jgi:hypothetical protein
MLFGYFVLAGTGLLLDLEIVSCYVLSVLYCICNFTHTVMVYNSEFLNRLWIGAEVVIIPVTSMCNKFYVSGLT